METHGPLGTLWVGIGLIGFYLALIWLNTLLGIFLTPLFMSFVKNKKEKFAVANQVDSTEEIQ